jgi:hypothetical protein
VGDSVSSDETYNAKLRDTFVDRQSYWQEWTSQDPTLFEEEDRTSSNMLNTHNQEREKERGRYNFLYTLTLLFFCRLYNIVA